MRQFLAPISSLMLLASLSLPASAIQFSNGATAFNHVPVLSAYGLSDSNLGVQAIYNLKVEVPANSDSALGSLVVELENPGSTLSIADFGKVRATLVSANGAVPVEVTVSEGADKKMIFAFSQPIAAGSTVDLQWTARNLREPGNYLFGVTAFPTGSSPRGQFLGFARLNIGTYGDGH